MSEQSVGFEVYVKFKDGAMLEFKYGFPGQRAMLTQKAWSAIQMAVQEDSVREYAQANDTDVWGTVVREVPLQDFEF